MRATAFSPAIEDVARHQACGLVRRSTPVINMGLEEIQKQAKAS